MNENYPFSFFYPMTLPGQAAAAHGGARGRRVSRGVDAAAHHLALEPVRDLDHHVLPGPGHPLDPAVVYIGPQARPAEVAVSRTSSGWTGRSSSTSYMGPCCGRLRHLDRVQAAGPGRDRLAVARHVRADLRGMTIAIVVGIPLGVLAAGRGRGLRPSSGSGRSWGSRSPRTGSGCCCSCCSSGGSTAAGDGRISSRPRFTTRCRRSRTSTSFDRRDRNWSAFRDVGPPHPARDHPRGVSGRADRADDARIDARSPRGGLHPHRSGVRAGDGSCSGGYALKNAIAATLSVFGLSFAFLTRAASSSRSSSTGPGSACSHGRAARRGLPGDHGDHVPRSRRLPDDQPDRRPVAGVGRPAGRLP